MGNGGRTHKQDPLRIERGITVIGLNGTRYACRVTGNGCSEMVSVLGRVTDSFADTNSASLAARKACEKGTPTFVSVSDRVHLAEEVPNAANVAAQIAQQRVNQRRGSFAEYKQ